MEVSRSLVCSLLGADVDGMRFVILNDVVLALSQVHTQIPWWAETETGNDVSRRISLPSAANKTSSAFLLGRKGRDKMEERRYSALHS